MQFVDLFCGAGLASRGLVQAGLVPTLGVDYWPVAAESYAANFGAALWSRVEAMPRLFLGEPSLVWLSPPCTEHSNARGARAADEDINALALLGAQLAAVWGATYVVVENHPAILSHGVRYALDAALRTGYQATAQVLCPHEHLGGPTRRERAFLVYARRGWQLPALNWPPRPNQQLPLSDIFTPAPVPLPGPGEPRCAADLIDWSLPVRPGHEGLSADATRAIAEYFGSGARAPGIYRYFKNSAVVPVDRAFPTVTGTQRYLLVTTEGRRMVTLAEQRRAMSLPPEHQLKGTQACQFSLLGNGVDVRMAEAIGRAILAAAAHGKTEDAWRVRERRKRTKKTPAVPAGQEA